MYKFYALRYGDMYWHFPTNNPSKNQGCSYDITKATHFKTKDEAIDFGKKYCKDYVFFQVVEVVIVIGAGENLKE